MEIELTVTVVRDNRSSYKGRVIKKNTVVLNKTNDLCCMEQYRMVPAMINCVVKNNKI